MGSLAGGGSINTGFGKRSSCCAKLQLPYKMFSSDSPCRCSGRGQPICSLYICGGEKCISELYVDVWDGGHDPVGQRWCGHHRRLQDHHLWRLSGHQPVQTE